MARPRPQQRSKGVDPEEIKYADSIRTDNGRMVRLSQIRPDTVLRIGGHELKAELIAAKMVGALLACGDTVRGIAISQGDVIFCEKHGEDEFVADIVS
jgi:hypothetical protein